MQIERMKMLERKAEKMITYRETKLTKWLVELCVF